MASYIGVELASILHLIAISQMFISLIYKF